VSDVVARVQRLPVPRFGTGEQSRDFFKCTYGPIIAVYRSIADDPGRTAALDHDLAELGRRHVRANGMEREYLLLTARKA